ncbi:hypothetical protein HJG54_33420 [Leptolyngbya sp. NK1-12]|uniref:Uncharacterized protein n=1 Tax=Leptolyngbya sp. NK1-12 TaxID=2547451 RepID=A0AA96WLR6_9CYAN|nr:hypothetical protein HJG54_33420 [Leptolyngbya sp. NK1-12]
MAAGFAAQLKQAFFNLQTALAAVGATPDQVVKITLLSVDDAERQQFRSVSRSLK